MSAFSPFPEWLLRGSHLKDVITGEQKYFYVPPVESSLLLLSIISLVSTLHSHITWIVLSIGLDTDSMQECTRQKKITDVVIIFSVVSITL